MNQSSGKRILGLLAKNMIFALLPTLILLLLTEITLALLCIGKPFERPARFWSGAMDMMHPDEFAGYRMQPNFSRNFVKLNSLGFRGDEFVSQANIKILVLGDSCAFGWMIDRAENTYASKLKRIMNEKLKLSGSLKTVEVLNAGTPSYTVYQGLQLYTHFLSQLTTWDAVIVTFGWNERPDVELDLEFTMRNPPLENRFLLSIRGVARHLRSYNALESLYYDYRLNSLKDPYLLAQEQYANYYTGLIRSASRHGAKVIVAAVITRPGDSSPLAERMRVFNRLAKNIAASERALWLDLNDNFVKHKEAINWFDDFHYDENGHSLVSQALWEQMNSWYVSPPGLGH